MSMGLGPKSRSFEINVTPLIDVLLVLLIIFMVLPSSFGERAEIPQAAAKPSELISPDVVVIQLLDSGLGKAPEVKINHDSIAWDSLEGKLQDIYEKRINKTVFLKGDPEIDFEYVAQVIDTAHNAGIDHVGLMGTSH